MSAGKANPDVQQDNRQDREPAQNIDSIQSRHGRLAIIFVEH
jgi:hypothetical protein